MSSLLIIAGIVLVSHCLYVASVRYTKLRYIQEQYGGRYSYSAEESKRTGKPRMIDSYQGVRDAQRIVRLISLWDAPFVFTKSLEFALFRTYGIPTISSLLLHTGQLSKSENASRRYVDTAGLITAFMTYPLPRLDFMDEDQPPSPGSWETNGEDPEDPRSAISLGRVNYLHGRWKAKISNDDLLYTLSVFIVEPPRWVDAYEWRKLTLLEKEALFALFYHIGRCMGIDNIPDTLEGLVEWSEEYNRANTVYTKGNAEVAKHTVDLLLYNLPAFAHSFGSNVVASLMDARLREAMGFAKPPAWICVLKDVLLKTRGAVVGLFFLPRNKPLSNLPLGCDSNKPEFSVDKFLDASMGMCPASGTLAKDGKVCPVGGQEKMAQMAKDTSAWRMELKWYENDPVYSRPHDKWSLPWVMELTRVKLGLLAAEDRRGSSKWRAATLPQEPAQPVAGLGGFRLEEMGPKGLETKGRQEVLKDAVKLHGRPLQGPWAFAA